MMSIDNDFSIDDKIKIQIDKSYVIDDVLINILKRKELPYQKKFTHLQFFKIHQLRK